MESHPHEIFQKAHQGLDKIESIATQNKNENQMTNKYLTKIASQQKQAGIDLGAMGGAIKSKATDIIRKGAVAANHLGSKLSKPHIAAGAAVGGVIGGVGAAMSLKGSGNQEKQAGLGTQVKNIAMGNMAVGSKVKRLVSLGKDSMGEGRITRSTATQNKRVAKRKGLAEVMDDHEHDNRMAMHQRRMASSKLNKAKNPGPDAPHGIDEDHIKDLTRKYNDTEAPYLSARSTFENTQAKYNRTRNLVDKGVNHLKVLTKHDTGRAAKVKEGIENAKLVGGGLGAVGAVAGRIRPP